MADGETRLSDPDGATFLNADGYEMLDSATNVCPDCRPTSLLCNFTGINFAAYTGACVNVPHAPYASYVNEINHLGTTPANFFNRTVRLLGGFNGTTGLPDNCCGTVWAGQLQSYFFLAEFWGGAGCVLGVPPLADLLSGWFVTAIRSMGQWRILWTVSVGAATLTLFDAIISTANCLDAGSAASGPVDLPLFTSSGSVAILPNG